MRRSNRKGPDKGETGPEEPMSEGKSIVKWKRATAEVPEASRVAKCGMAHSGTHAMCKRGRTRR